MVALRKYWHGKMKISKYSQLAHLEYCEEEPANHRQTLSNNLHTQAKRMPLSTPPEMSSWPEEVVTSQR